METLGKRLRELRKARGLSLEEAGRLLTLSFSTLAMYERAERTPPADKLHQLANFYGVSVDYLLGRHQRVADQPTPFYTDLPVGTWPVEPVPIPILSHVHLKNPAWISQNIEGYTFLAKNQTNDGEFFALRVQEECMVPARILPGDLVIVRRQPRVDNGEIAVVHWAGKEAALLRRVRTMDKQILLTADNPVCPPELLPPQKVMIFGKVVEVKFEPTTTKE